MNVVVGRIRLHIPSSQSLKDKRRVVKSITSRTGSRYNVSIAEVDDQNLWQIATLGVSCIGNDASHAKEVLSKVVESISRSYPGIETVDCQVEILTGL